MGFMDYRLRMLLERNEAALGQGTLTTQQLKETLLETIAYKEPVASDTHILFVSHHIMYTPGCPLTAELTVNTSLFHFPGNRSKAVAVNHPLKDLPHNGSVGWVDFDFIPCDPVTEQETNLYQFTLFKGFPYPPFLVFAG